jgi:hypothetical protein
VSGRGYVHTADTPRGLLPFSLMSTGTETGKGSMPLKSFRPTHVQLHQVTTRHGIGLRTVLDDGRVCVSAAPWYGGSITRALNDFADQGQPIASRNYRGALLVEARLVLFSEAAGEPPYDLAAVEAAVRAAVANSGQR